MIAQIVAALKDTIASPAVATIYERPPMALHTSDLPAVVIMHTGGEYGWQAAGLSRRAMRYALHIIVEPVAQSRLPERVAEAQSLYGGVIDKLLTDPTLGGAADHTRDIRDDNGYHVIQWGGVDYFGYTLLIEVVQKL